MDGNGQGQRQAEFWGIFLVFTESGWLKKVRCLFCGREVSYGKTKKCIRCGAPIEKYVDEEEATKLMEKNEPLENSACQ